MSRRANITEMLVSALVSVGVACSSAAPVAPQEQLALTRIAHCVGDVVPLCADIRVYEDGVIEYARRGKRVLRGRLTGRAADEMRQMLATLSVSTWPNTNDPIGSFVTFDVAEDKRTVLLREIPPDAVAVLQLIDREGRRLFGSAYRPIVSAE